MSLYFYFFPPGKPEINHGLGQVECLFFFSPLEMSIIGQGRPSANPNLVGFEVEEGEGGGKIDEADMHCTRNCKNSKYLLYQNMLSYSKVCPSHVAENTFSTCLLKQTKANVKNIRKPYGNVK